MTNTMVNPLAGYRLESDNGKPWIVFEFYGETGERVNMRFDMTARLGGISNGFDIAGAVLAHAEENGWDGTMVEFDLEDEGDTDGESDAIWDELEGNQQ